MSTSTKTQLIHEASKIFLAHGYNGFSLQDLAKSLHIQKSSLFHYFPTKSALAVELIRFYQNSFIEWTHKVDHLKPHQQVLKYADKVTHWICDKNRICPVGNITMEWQNVDSKIKKEILILHKLQRNWLKKILNVPDKNITAFMSLFQGSVQLARIHNKPSMVVDSVKVFLQL